jgi:hypothetical protein
LPEKNYDIMTLHTLFRKLGRLLINLLIIPEHIQAANELGLACLSSNDNLIQKYLFQQIQAKVQTKVKTEKIAMRTGDSFQGVIRWVMGLTGLTGQRVIEAYKISMKRHRHHAKRCRIEDLYTENELRELVFHVEKKLKIAKNNKQIVALYFARIQLKTCWNTSPLSDIELSDISEIELPTEKKAITVLTQKPRNGYKIECYQLDGRSIRSAMHDILHVRDVITSAFRKDNTKLVNNYLFIYQERSDIKRLEPTYLSAYITSLLKSCGCSINYNSMRIRKNGANHIYREVAKNMRDYESSMRHDFSTFINNYQRINEVETHKTLHDAVDIMQKYFTGREISADIKILMVDDFSLQKTPTGECASLGNDNEFHQYKKEHKLLHKKNDNKSVWCSDYLACIWCKHFRTVADPEHVWQLLSYRNYVLADMYASVSNIDNNDSQTSAITALHERVNSILAQLEIKSQFAVNQGKKLLLDQGMHPFWSFAITTNHS